MSSRSIPARSIPSRSKPEGLRPTATARSGISLLEILIAMFVLLIGLMGVASLFPVGSHYAANSDRYDRGSALSAAAFDELVARSILQPEHWLYGDPSVIGQTDLSSETASPVNKLSVIQPQLVYVGGTPPNQANPQAARIGSFNISDPSIGPGRAFVIDPIGTAAAVNASNQYFPQTTYASGAPALNIMNPWSQSNGGPYPENFWPIRRVTLPTPNPAIPLSAIPMPLPVADTIFSLHDPLSVELPEEDDQPAMQRWRTLDPNGTPEIYTDDTLLRRQYAADYTWLATVVPATADGLQAMQPASSGYGSKYYDVSVAVFYKREEIPSPTSERLLQAALLPGGEVELIGPDLATLDKALEDLRPNQWIALAGVNQRNGAFLLKWYRLLSLDEKAFQENGGGTHNHVVRRAMLDGPNWPSNSITNLRAIILPGIVSVTTRPMKLQQD